MTKDGSTEFLLAYKIFPVHERVQVGTEGLTDGMLSASNDIDAEFKRNSSQVRVLL